MITLRPGENIIAIKRRHWIILARDLLFPALIIFLIILFAILILFVKIEFPSWLLKFVPFLPELKFFLVSVSLFMLQIFWILSFVIIINYCLDSWIITNERTIHIELKKLFSRTVSSINHDRIQDITVKAHGFIPTIFRFGDLHLQTAGEFREFIFSQIPDPFKTKEIIFQAQRELLKNFNNVK